jgi:cytoskeletal protein CcmA (bactofilin family)
MFGRKQRPKVKIARLSSLIAAGVEIIGDVVVTDGVRVDGLVQGSVLSKKDAKALLVLSDQGRINGCVKVQDAVINGAICGDVEVEDFLELQAGARITGNIRYRRLQMECGARVEGRLECVIDRSDAIDRSAERGAPPSNVVNLSKQLPTTAEG